MESSNTKIKIIIIRKDIYEEMEDWETMNEDWQHIDILQYDKHDYLLRLYYGEYLIVKSTGKIIASSNRELLKCILYWKLQGFKSFKFVN